MADGGSHTLLFTSVTVGIGYTNFFVDDIRMVSCPLVGEGEGKGELAQQRPHTADLDGNYSLSLRELLRVIQFFNVNGFSCAIQDKAISQEDGYLAVPPGDTSCTPHDSDYNAQDWDISLSELLRLIQLYASQAYYYCPENVSSEDNFCLGAFPF